MNSSLPIEVVSDLLRNEISQQRVGIIEPLDTDSFIARSALQKAIRRGNVEIALNAAATLMTTDPNVLWRRLVVTALEDIGVGEIELLRKIAAINTKTARNRIGDDWAIATEIVRQCCSATKCQAANDLTNIAYNDPDYSEFRRHAETLQSNQLLDLVADLDRDIVERQIVVQTYLDNEPRLKSGMPTKQYHDQLFEILPNGKVDGLDLKLYAWAFRYTRLSLAPASILLLSQKTSLVNARKLVHVEDQMTDIVWISGVPSYALDQYTRWGRKSLRAYIESSSKWRRFAERLAISRSDQLKAAGELLFRAEGAVLSNRRQWESGSILYYRSRHLGCFLPNDAVDDGLALIYSELPLINCLRKRAYRSCP